MINLFWFGAGMATSYALSFTLVLILWSESR